MLYAKDVRWYSDKVFEMRFKEQLEHIEKYIDMLSNQGMRSVYIDNTNEWVSENDDVTRRIIAHLKELGYDVRVVAGSGGYVSEWKEDCSGIDIGW